MNHFMPELSKVARQMLAKNIVVDPIILAGYCGKLWENSNYESPARDQFNLSLINHIC